jgi:hypothetical protein
MSTYGTFDPAEVVPGRQATLPEVLKDEQGNELPGFDERYKEPFTGLLYLGALTKSFSYLGHNFVVRTIGPREQLAIALIVKDYVGSPGEQMAYTTAVVAMACVSVDGQELPSPVGEDAQLADWARHRFNYVTNNWWQLTIAKVFEQYLEVESTAVSVVEAMGKAFGSSADSTPGSNGTSA